MRLKNGNHLMYCLNIHPGESWEENFAAIQDYALKVKATICANQAFALGLRLSANAARDLIPKLQFFKNFLLQNDLYVVSINGFPYGLFHGAVIKKNVYLPDWDSSLRVSYTLDLIKILSNLLPEGEIGTISTLPCHYGKIVKPSTIDNLLYVKAYLADIEKKSGKHIILSLEPEPACYLDSLDSTLTFFNTLYSIDESARRYLGVCLDTCHIALEFESPLVWLKKLTHAAIPLQKIQISAAPSAEVSQKNPQKDSQNIFGCFDEKHYLHQTSVLSSGEIFKFSDLSDALESAPAGQWRVHFHVPLSWFRNNIYSTALLIEDDFIKQTYLRKKMHFEIETYAYWVLPGAKKSIVDSITSEIQWVLKKFPYLR
ncbi:MAG: metabolite traffic protein EboE [bacterium]